MGAMTAPVLTLRDPEGNLVQLLETLKTRPCLELSEVLRSVRRIVGLAAFRPVTHLCGKVWPWLPDEIRGHVDGVRIGQRPALPDGHIGFDEPGGVTQSRHPGRDVEGL